MAPLEKAGASPRSMIPESRSEYHSPALDGVRGLGIILIFAFHFANGVTGRNPFDRALLGVLNSAWVAVSLFFALSGLLITGIILDTEGRPGQLRDFYARRVRRIVPLYYTMLLAVAVLAPLIPAGRANGTVQTLHDNQLWFWTFLVDARVAATRSWAPAVAGRFNHLWSLSVTAQFYLIWPLVVLYTPRRRLPWICAAVIVASLVVRVLLRIADHGPVDGYLYQPFVAPYALFTARLDAMAIGAAIAWFVREADGYARLRRVTAPIAVVSALAIIPMSLSAGAIPIFTAPGQTIGYLALGLLSAALIILAIDPAGGRTRRICEWRPLRALAPYGYGLFVVHYALQWTLYVHGLDPSALFPRVPTVLPGLVLATAVGFALSLGIAMASWHFFEAPLLRVERLSPAERQV